MFTPRSTLIGAIVVAYALCVSAMPARAAIAPAGDLIGIGPQSLAPGIRLGHFSQQIRSVTDENGLPEMSLSEKLELRAHDIEEKMGVCACGATSTAPLARMKPIGQTTLKGADGERFAVSVVSFDFALKLFQAMKRDLTFGARTLREGCHARAHESALIFERRGVLVGKITALGRFQILDDQLPSGHVNWRFHVAPIVVVSEGGVRRVWVLDPALFSEPVTVESWLSLLMQNPGAKLTDVFVTNRFVFHPKQRFLGVKRWRSVDFKVVRQLLDQIDAR